MYISLFHSQEKSHWQQISAGIYLTDLSPFFTRILQKLEPSLSWCRLARRSSPPEKVWDDSNGPHTSITAGGTTRPLLLAGKGEGTFLMFYCMVSIFLFFTYFYPFIFPVYSASNWRKKNQSIKKIMLIRFGHSLHFMVGLSPVIPIIPGMIL